MTDINEQILNTPLGDNDAGAATVRDYLVALLAELWREEEGFSGKRPFGNSDWQYDLYAPLIKAGLIGGTLDEDGYVDLAFDTNEADERIIAAIRSLGSQAGWNNHRLAVSERDAPPDEVAYVEDARDLLWTGKGLGNWQCLHAPGAGHDVMGAGVA
jgi:hypothetical protein